MRTTTARQAQTLMDQAGETARVGQYIAILPADGGEPGTPTEAIDVLLGWGDTPDKATAAAEREMVSMDPQQATLDDVEIVQIVADA